MAIDSATKRASIAAIGLMSIGPTVIPTGSFDAADRLVIAYSYSGISAVATAVALIALATGPICPDLRITMD
jgi:hypothetical protein